MHYSQHLPVGGQNFPCTTLGVKEFSIRLLVAVTLTATAIAVIIQKTGININYESGPPATRPPKKLYSLWEIVDPGPLLFSVDVQARGKGLTHLLSYYSQGGWEALPYEQGCYVDADGLLWLTFVDSFHECSLSFERTEEPGVLSGQAHRVVMEGWPTETLGGQLLASSSEFVPGNDIFLKLWAVGSHGGEFVLQGVVTPHALASAVPRPASR